MEKLVNLILLFCLIFLYYVSALQINEVMPDCGNLTANCEFIELYSESLQDLTGYVLDTTGQKLNLNSSFQGFLIITKHKNAFIDRFDSLNVIEWRGMGLANEGDSIRLIYQNTTIDSYSYSKANKNLSWQLIDTAWKECEPNPARENSCKNQINKVNEEKIDNKIESSAEKTEIKNISDENEDTTPIKIIKIETDEKRTDINNEGIKEEVIRLNAKKDINVYKSRNEKIKENAIYGFALLCVIIIAVLLIKKKPKNG